ncbi:lipoprotein [Actinokineospora sp. NBRC 105648]|uniref:lipoprotein n=1 Tax=Actinokineospora sp. NBRC 105648 TaxID=3032206 RepID=UPI0024A3C497|nr:lipoprotein [Actinokineospora sp. NBRC 105648]GLZ41694.1 hypothetical protein Acsp05_53180 [Actinokineospora sp. NBRC 105648]
MRRIVLFTGIVSVAAVIGGCGGGAGSDDPAAPSTAPPTDVWDAGAKAAPGVTRVGSPQACPMPFAFDIAAGWQPSPATAESRAGLAAACRVSTTDGDLRVWIGGDPGGTSRLALDQYLQGEGPTADPTYRDTGVGQGAGVELTYSKPGGEARGRAFALATPLRTIVVSVAADDPAAYRKVLAGYLLAKDSLTPVER